jgi:hypothetical protein
MPFLDASALNDNREGLIFLRSVLGGSKLRAAASAIARTADMAVESEPAGSAEVPAAELSFTSRASEPPKAAMPLVIGVAVPVSVTPSTSGNQSSAAGADGDCENRNRPSWLTTREAHPGAAAAEPAADIPASGPAPPGTGDVIMSSAGNRSNPNQTRTGGHPADGSENPNRSDITDRTQAGSSSPGGRTMSSGSNRETREHNKHNHQTQSGHKPQQHSPAEEKR